MISPNTRSKNHQNTYKLGWLRISSPYPKEFSCFHPPINSFSRKPSPPSTLGILLRPPQLGSKIYQQSKAQPNREPTASWLSRKWDKARLYIIVNPGKSHANDIKMINNPMHEPCIQIQT